MQISALLAAAYRPDPAINLTSARPAAAAPAIQTSQTSEVLKTSEVFKIA